MKKLLFVVLLLIATYVFLHILNILIYDLERLTQYGYGYLAGKSLILLLCITCVLVLGKKIFGRDPKVKP